MHKQNDNNDNPPQANEIQIERHRKLFRIALGIAGACSLLALLFCQEPPNDVASCYARHVRAFADGNWGGAFFHMTPPLVPVFAGAIAFFTRIEPFAALKLVSAVFFIAALWPLRRLLNRVLPPELVGWGCILYVCTARLIRYMSTGLLETAKVFFLLWLVVLLLEFCTSKKTSKLVYASVTFAGLALSRGEGVFFLPLAFLGLWLLPALGFDQIGKLKNIPQYTSRRIKETLVFSGIVLFLCLPQIIYIYNITGTPGLDSRQTQKINSLLEQWRKSNNNHATNEQPTAKDAAPNNAEEEKSLDEKIRLNASSPVLSDKKTKGSTATTTTQTDGEDEDVRSDQAPPSLADTENLVDYPIVRPTEREEDIKTPMRSVREAFKGLDRLLLGLSAFGIFMLIKRRDWKLEHTACLTVIIYNAALFAANGFITKRYTTPTTPFLLPMAVVGAVFVKTSLLDRWHSRAFAILATIILVIQVWDGLSKVRPSWPPEPNVAKEVGEWIQENGDRFVDADDRRLQTHPQENEYHDGLLPIVAATAPQYAYWGESDWMMISNDHIYDAATILAMIRQQQPHFLIVNRELREICVDVETLIDDLHPVKTDDRWESTTIYQVPRNLWK